MAAVKIDGVEYPADAGANLLETCLNLGLDLPYFCWHPALGSIGACRQCAMVQYQREEDAHGRIVMGCMTPVTDGAIFSLGGAQAQAFRAAIVESLMLNHPHDCPVCAEGGECHLQDMTVMVGHRDRHYRGRKNTHRNQYLGPLIHHEMNRCITCYRCTRYYRDYAGGTDLAAMAAHDHIYFGRHQEGLLESEFAGNLVEVCPTGVFTDKSLVHEYTRKWDLQSAPSVCVGCAVGCNTLPGERYGKLKRIHNRFNNQVNGYFLCDRGRFGGGFVNSEKRLDYAARRQENGCFSAVDTALALAQIKAQLGTGKVAGIGSPRASVESNFALQQRVGADKFSTGMSDIEARKVSRALAHLASSSAYNPAIADIERADAILILGEDVTHTAPRSALALRQAVRNLAYTMAAKLNLQPWQDAAIRNLAQNQRSPLHIVASYSTGLSEVAATNHCLPPGGQQQLAADILEAITGNSGNAAARRIAADLAAAEKPLIIGGCSGAEPLMDQAAHIAAALVKAGKSAMLSYCLPECNSLGVAMLAQDVGTTLEQISAWAQAGEVDTLIILENDLFRRAPEQQVTTLLDTVACCIGIDCLESATLERCDWILPAAAFTEAEGTLINSEGRAQRSFPVHTPPAQRRPGWLWLGLMQGLDTHFDALSQQCADTHGLLAHMVECAPDHTYRSRGLKIPRQPHRYSGRTAMRADISVHEPKQVEDQESPLAFTMEGRSGEQPGALMTHLWSPGWNSNQSLHKFQGEVGGALRGGTGGTRLLDGTGIDAPKPASANNHAGQGQWLLVPRHQTFGSDELSMQADRIRAVAGPARIYLNSETASQLNVTQGEGVSTGDTALEVHIDDSLPQYCVAFSANHPDTVALEAWSYTDLNKAAHWVRSEPQLIASDAVGDSHA